MVAGIIDRLCDGGFGGTYKESPQSIGVCISGFHLSNIILPPLPILPRELYERADAGSCVDVVNGGTIPAAASFDGSRGFVKSNTGSSGSCINT